MSIQGILVTNQYCDGIFRSVRLSDLNIGANLTVVVILKEKNGKFKHWEGKLHILECFKFTTFGPVCLISY